MFRTRSPLLFVCLILAPFLNVSAWFPNGSTPRVETNLFDLAQPKGTSCGTNNGSFLTFNPEAETYKLSATYYSLKDNLTTSLMLNNKGAQPILATPTIYSLGGVRLNLGPITVPATSYIDVDMHQLLAGQPEEFREGSLKIAYTGGSLQLGAQVKMVEAANNLIWVEQFVYTTKFTSSRLENVWWLPFENTKTRVVLSNTSGATVTATIDVDGTSPQQNTPLQITLAPWETRVLEIMRDIVGNENGELDEYGGISITHSGSPGDVLARMFIAKPNKGYSAATNFIDPDSTASQKWHGSGLRFKNLNGAQLTPVVSVRNTGEQTSHVSGKIMYTQPNGEVATINLAQKTIGAGVTKSFELENFIDALPASVTYGGIEIEYDTPKGSIITSVQSISQNGDHVFQVPTFDPQNMPVSAGGFPWKADGDFRTLVYIKNETDTIRKYTAYLTYEEGQYSFGDHTLKPHQTVAIDFRKIRDEQTPDINGKRIPLDVSTGQIAWSARGIETRVMSGRSEQISISNGVASTYACYSCCTFAIYNWWISPSGATISIGGGAYFVAWEQYHSCNSQVFSPQPAADLPLWFSWNSTVASVDGGYAVGNSPGNATIQASWYTDETVGFEVCEPYAQQVVAQASVTVTAPTVQVNEVGFAGDHKITIWPAASPTPIVIDPDDSTPTWKSTGNPNHPVAYTKGGTVTMFAKLGVSPSIPNRNVKIRVKNGSTVIANKDIELGGSSVTITGISTSSALESTVKKTTPTFSWEISYNGGSSWSSIGSSGPHTMYWTYATPLSPPFANDFGGSFSPIYDEALGKATGYVNGSADLSTIIGAINTGVQEAVFYEPGGGLVNVHPMQAYSSPNQGNCSDHTHLLRGLLRSIGIDSKVNYIWGGANSSTLTYYQRYNTTQTPSFQIEKAAKEGAEVDPHFLYHAMIKANNNWYDPSYGDAPPSIFSLAESAFNNTPRQIQESRWTSEPIPNPLFSCPHPPN